MSRFVIEKLLSFCVHSCIAGRLLNVVLSFLIQMLGSCPVTKAHGPGCADEAVEKIVANTKKVCLLIQLFLFEHQLWQSPSNILYECRPSDTLQRSPYRILGFQFFDVPGKTKVILAELKGHTTKLIYLCSFETYIRIGQLSVIPFSKKKKNLQCLIADILSDMAPKVLKPKIFVQAALLFSSICDIFEIILRLVKSEGFSFLSIYLFILYLLGKEHSCK